MNFLLNRRLLFFVAFCLFTTTAKADVQELYPDNNVAGSGKKVILFEARKGAIEGGTSGPVGHVFVKLGTELDNGMIHVHSIFGYYPSHGKLYEVRLIVAKAAEIKFDLPADLQTDLTQKYYVSDIAYANLVATAKTYLIDNPTYSLVTGSNCVRFVGAMAKAAGLSTPDFNVITFPGEMIESIQKANGNDPKVVLPKAGTPKVQNGRGEGEPTGQPRASNERDRLMGRDIWPIIPDGIPIERGGLVPGQSGGGGGNITFGWPSVRFRQNQR